MRFVGREEMGTGALSWLGEGAAGVSSPPSSQHGPVGRGWRFHEAVAGCLNSGILGGKGSSKEVEVHGLHALKRIGDGRDFLPSSEDWGPRMPS